MSDGAPREQIRAVLEASFLAGLPEAIAEAVLADAIWMEVPRACMVYEPGGAVAVVLVSEGLLRVFVSAPDGRQLTVRYVSRGDELGVSLLFAARRPVSVQALSSTRLVLLDLERVRALALVHAELAWRVARELAHLLDALGEELRGNVFGSIRQRVARHLLDLASPAADELAATISHQGLADAVGTAREVVSRVIRDLRAEGLVATTTGRIVIVDPQQLYELGESA